MKRRRPATPDRTGIAVPPELRCGALSEVWSTTGHRYDLGSAWGRHGQARRAFCAAAGLDTAAECALMPSAGPWALESEHGPERLARLGFTPADIPALRVAAQLRYAQTHALEGEHYAHSSDSE